MSEVPATWSLDECAALVAAVASSGRVYMMAENMNFFHYITEWKKCIQGGEIGHVFYAEAEYIHDCRHIMRAAGGQRAWRASMPPIHYCTHSLGPLLDILDDRCVSVSCRSAPYRSPDAPLRTDGQIALFETAKGTLIKIMVTLNTHRPSEHRYRIFGIEGGAEWFSYEKAARRFVRNAHHEDGWEVVPVGLGASGDDTSAGHGGASTLPPCRSRATLAFTRTRAARAKGPSLAEGNAA